MGDIIIEAGAAPVTVCLTGAVLGYVIWIGRKEQLHSQKGWWYVVAGIALLFLAGVVDTIDEFTTLKKYIIFGEPASQTFVETVCYAGGAILFLIGFLHWLPVVGALRKAEQDLTGEIEERMRAEDALRAAFDKLEMRVKERTAELSAANEALGKEIDERKEAEEALKQNEGKWRTLFNNANDAVFLYPVSQDGEYGRFIEVNEVACQRLGYTRDELLEMSPIHLNPAEQRTEMPVMMRQRLEGRSATFERTHVAKDGTHIPVEISSRPFVLDGQTVMLSIVRDITERKRTEEALRASEEQHRKMLDNYPDGVTLQIDGLITYANPMICQLTGYSFSDVLGQAPEKFTMPEERGLVRDRVRKLLAGASGRPVEYHLLKKDGDILPVEVTSLVIDYSGKPALLNILRDITQRKRTEEALKQSEEQHRALLDVYPDGVLVEVDSKITYCNPALMEISGYTEEEILGAPPAQFIAPEDRQRAFAVVRKLLDGASGGTREYRVLKKDGSIMPTEITSRLITYTGKPALLSVVRDVTQRKQTEEARQEAEELYRTLVDNSVLGLGIYTPGERLFFSNQRLTEIVGYTKEECESPEFNFMGLFRAEDQKLIADNTRKRVAGEDIPPYEVRLITKDQTVKWVEIHNVFVRHRGRGAMQVQLLEVTERKRAEQRLQETSRLASIGELAAGVAHEINNPLTSVLGFSQLLMAEDLPPEIRADIQTIHSGAQRAAKVVQNLLSFATKRDYREEYLDVTKILERALEIKSYDLSTSNIRITTELSADLPRTSVDEHQLIQVIVNLLTNAHHAIETAGRKGQIIIRSSESEGKIRVSISDNGPGIPPENLNRIFEPFFTTKRVGEGTGLGLSICYGIIRQHGGNLWAESVPGEGATFHIELPIVGPEGKEEEGPFDRQLQQTSSTTKHLLVVDDEPAIRDLLARSLELERYTVDLAEEGEEAWRKLQAQSYDCIILDLKMPGMSGQELYRRIEGSDTGLAKKVIFITGDTISPEAQDFVTATGSPMLSKPWDMEVLRRQVHEMLEATRDA